MATVKKSQGFTLIEVLIASAVSLISLGVICTAYYVGMETFRFNQKRMEAINTLCLSTDRIKKEIREGEKFISSDNPGFHDFITSLPDPDNSLIFASSDITAIAFYFEKDSNGQFHLYKKTSGSESKVIISFDPGVEVKPEFSNISDSSVQINLTAEWIYRGKTKKTGEISSIVTLRNWNRQ
ncbi:hypothetical protein ES703_91147 [subsurface metagenome]